MAKRAGTSGRVARVLRADTELLEQPLEVVRLVDPVAAGNVNRVTDPTTVPVTSVHVVPLRTQNFTGTLFPFGDMVIASAALRNVSVVALLMRHSFGFRSSTSTGVPVST